MICVIMFLTTSYANHQYVYIRTAIFLCLDVSFRPRFQSDHLARSLTGFSKKLSMCTTVFTHKHTELPTSSLYCNQWGLHSLVMGSFQFISATGGHPLSSYVTIQRANIRNSFYYVASWQSAFTPWIAIITKILLFMCPIIRGGLKRAEKEGTGVKWDNHLN